MTERSTPLPPAANLLSACEERRALFRRSFECDGSGVPTLHALCELADETLHRAWNLLHPAELRRFCLLALGGYGRRMLFPHSDLDVLFLFEDEPAEKKFKPLVAELSRTLWDLGFRVSSAGRTIEECRRVEENNVEFHLALLDRRLLAGDVALYERLDTRILRDSERRARDFLTTELIKLTKERHARYGNTIFHLEPNVKDAPGGLRDHHAWVWLEALAQKAGSSVRNPPPLEEPAASAIEFLSAVRCFLHYANGRNDNSLTYELQQNAAQRSLGAPAGSRSDPAEWMRLYFQHARTLNRRLLQRIELRPEKRRSLWAGRLRSSARAARRPFVVEEGRLILANPAALADRSGAFAFLLAAAQSGCPPAREAEEKLAEAWRWPADSIEPAASAWPRLRELLSARFPAVALRPMHRLGLLADIFPEFRCIDALVVRDFYHRYTVDEHSLRTIEHLQELAEPRDERAAHFSDLWTSLDRRELLVLAMLLHDVGKGMPNENHVAGSLEALEAAAARFGLDPQEKDEARFLIEHHLDMSATLLRRDIFDAGTTAAFARTVETPERLSRLCLLTYADIHAVNPEALTPWKAEMLWQLFAATSNHISRSLDRDRLHIVYETPFLEEVCRQAKARIEDVEWFLEGFPRRYLAAHSPAEVAAHFALYKKLAEEPVQSELKARQHAFSLTVLTPDRPALFATIAGVLAGWGMNIVKADAFANAAGIVLDTFHFEDLHRTLVLNPGEAGRFARNLADIVGGRAPLEPLLKGRLRAARARPPKVRVPLAVRFDDASSAHSTLLELVTQDRPGLLYEIGSVLARCGCNIEVALIDTEGQKAIDVFYLTSQGRRLGAEKQEELRGALAQALA
jgi:[protein-PII] uridylyltransferase